MKFEEIINFPFFAVWETKYHFPIEVISYLGEINGRHYVAIKNSITGIPLDEIIFLEQKILLTKEGE